MVNGGCLVVIPRQNSADISVSVLVEEFNTYWCSSISPVLGCELFIYFTYLLGLFSYLLTLFHNYLFIYYFTYLLSYLLGLFTWLLSLFHN